MLGLRQKLFLAFSGLILLLVLVAALATRVIGHVSLSFDKIFHENLASIDACRTMQGALEEMNEGLLVSLWEGAPQDLALAERNRHEFVTKLQFQKGNVTVRGEQALTDSLVSEWNLFETHYFGLLESRSALSDRRNEFRTSIMPLSHGIADLTREVAELNAQNILSADGQVRAQAHSARRTMTGLLLSGGIFTLILLFMTGRFVLEPIRALTNSVQEVEQGNLDLVLEVRSKDELGQLAEAFNAMALKLREFRRSDRAKLVRTQKTTQMAINSLPDAVAVLNVDGTVEMSNEPAQTLFGIKPGTRVESLELEWLTLLFEKVIREVRAFNPQTYESVIQVFRDGEEKFFLPHAIPILDDGRQMSGVTLVLADVTELRRLDESKSDLLSTVSHELKTRLTSVRMAVHLLLDENIGETNSRQTELLLAAREDTERLHRMIEGLLDIGRIRSGHLKMEMKPIGAQELVLHAVDAVKHGFQEKGLHLDYELPAELPAVLADPSRVHLILDNLLSNALKYTSAGGHVAVSAEAEEDQVRFRVTDSGTGIPVADLPKVFERFYRGAHEGEPDGAGLGLAIAKEVVEAHGGEISVESQEGVGTTFRFTLKQARPV